MACDVVSSQHAISKGGQTLEGTDQDLPHAAYVRRRRAAHRGDGKVAIEKDTENAHGLV